MLQLEHLYLHIKMHYPPHCLPQPFTLHAHQHATTHHTAFHNPSLHTTNKHKAILFCTSGGKMAQDVGIL